MHLDVPMTTTIATLCATLDTHVDQILEEWLVLASEEPWMRLSREERLDDMRELIRAILDASLCSSHELEVHRRKIEAATRHGDQRRQQQFDAPLLLAGYHFIREAMRRHLAECGMPHRAVTDALMRIDVATTMATMASLRGFYRTEHEALGRWSEVVDEMARESLNLQPRL